jgi:Protein tyrosine and serine/threonine kinase
MGSAVPPTAAMLLSVAKPIVLYDRQVSSGAMGQIWLARLADGPEVGRLVSVRRIPASKLTGQVREQLRKGESVCVNLRNASLLKLLAVCEDDAEVLSISENLHGVSLLDLKRFLIETQTPMSPQIALRVIRDAARAGTRARQLAEEQKAFYGRRLLYNETIFVAAFGETLLRDTGVITNVADAPQIRENPTVIVGLSPEELSGPKVSQTSSEVFSLGILLWELLSNRPAFSQRDTQRATSAVISQPIAPLDRIDRIGMPLPKELVSLVTKAIDRDPRRRTIDLTTFADLIDDTFRSYLGTAEQVGHAIQRFAGGFLSEKETGHRWSVGVESDSFPIDSSRGGVTSILERDFEPETLADRARLEQNLLELRRRSELEREDGTSILDAPLVVASNPRRKNYAVWAIIILLLIAIAALGLFRLGSGGLFRHRVGTILDPSGMVCAKCVFREDRLL